MILLREVSVAAVVVAATLACGGGRQAGGTGGTNTGGASGSGTGGGGSPGTGGSAGTAANDACVGQDAAATGTATLIDDLEDGDAEILSSENRAGSWWWSTDGMCASQSPAFAAEAPSNGNASNYAVHVAAEQCTSWGANTGFSFNVKPSGSTFVSCAYNANVFDGISFWAAGDGVTLHVAVATRKTIPIESGGDGTCPDETVSPVKTCYDSFATDI